MADCDFWLAVRQAALSFVDAVETHKLDGSISMRTAEMRKLLKAYQRRYSSPPGIAAKDVRERIEVLRLE